MRRQHITARTLAVLALVFALLAGVSAPAFAGHASATTAALPAASRAQTHAAFLDKTRFLAHAGIAFFAIHHEYKRFREGYFASSARHRTRNIVVAAAVLLIAYHEAKVAYGIAEKSHSKTLHALVKPFDALVTEIEAVRGRFTKGDASSSDLASLNNDTTSINHQSAQTDVGTIHDVSTPLPSGA